MQRRTIDKKPAFLAAYAVCASLTEAAKAVKIDRNMHYQWLRDDAAYVAAFKQAKIEAGQTLKDDAVAWARHGIFEPNVYQGQFLYEQRERTLCLLPDGREVPLDELPEDLDAVQIVSRRTVMQDDPARPLGIWRRSEGMLGRLLKAFMPEEFGDRVSAEISGPGGGPIELLDQRLKTLTDDELAQLIALAKKLAPTGGDGSGNPPAGA